MKSISTIGARRWGVIGALAFTIVMNILSVTLPFNNQTNEDVSDKYQTLFTPAGYAFSIWSLIYLTLIIYALYQAFRASEEKKIYDKIAAPLIINCIANGLWLLAFQYEYFGLSVLIMLVILGTLMIINTKLSETDEISGKEKTWVRLPFSVYLGWISVATIVNISVFLTSAGWNGWGINEATWVLIMLVVVAVLTLSVQYKSPDYFYPLVIVWALIAIAIKQSDVQIIYFAALGLAVLLGLLDVVYIIVTKGQKMGEAEQELVAY